MRRKANPGWLLATIAVWLVAVIMGMAALYNYSHTPGAVGSSTNWPIASQLRHDEIVPTLVVALHPKCSCSEATVTELSRVLAQVPKLRVYVLAVFPDEQTAADWKQTPLLRRAAQLAPVKLVLDPGGVEAKRFGAQTSGYAVLFGPNGQRLFGGGITDARGHEGDNAGEEALIQLAMGQASDFQQSSVFGCSLFENTLPAELRSASSVGGMQ